MSSIVLGLNFGDEGKGLTTSFLCSKNEYPLVVRFNGGHQAGHTVNYNGKRHVFSSFGSGTLQNVPTYWSEYCTFYPIAFLNEYKTLDHPKVYIHPLSPVTTPYDVNFNKLGERVKKHGSVGVGFGATIQRQENYFKLFVQDLFYEKVLLEKLKNIHKYYNEPDIDISEFIDSVSEIKNLIELAEDNILCSYDPIFEGGQGILLDQDFGFFPNVTRSNTTSKNALELACSSIKEIYYVTRTYLTRHGNGFLPNEDIVLDLKNNANETNKTHEFQGNFRVAPLDVDLLNYSLQCDNHFSSGLAKNLVITCNDQLPIDVELLLSKLKTKFNKVFISNGDSLEDIHQYY